MLITITIAIIYSTALHIDNDMESKMIHTQIANKTKFISTNRLNVFSHMSGYKLNLMKIVAYLLYRYNNHNKRTDA